MLESTEAQATMASARQESLHGRAGQVDWPAPVSSLDQPSYEIVRQAPSRMSRPQHDPPVFHLSRTVDQESLSY